MLKTLKDDILHFVYSDEHIVVALKPEGLLAVPGRGVDKQNCLSARLAAQLGPIHIAHRLDLATSGLMVFARSLEALRALHAQFRTGTVEKAYEAIVQGDLMTGKPEQTSLSIDLPLSADWPNRPKQKINLENGRRSITQVEALSFDVTTNTSRVKLIPVTGRTHQLRVHMMAVGHPIVGDALYSPIAGLEVSSERVFTSAQLRTHRLMLHASQLAFVHPETGERLVFESAPEF